MYAVAATVLVAVAVLIGVIALNRRSGRLEAIKHGQADLGIEQNATASSSPTPTVVPSPSSVTGSVTVATLKDGAGEVTIDKNGRVTGLDELDDNSRQYVARAALAEQLEAPAVLRQLSGEPSGLRGPDSSQQGFRLLYPVQRVVTEDRPVFRWDSLAGVSSYRVYVLDKDGNQVTQSEDLLPTQTQWKAPVPLRRGQVFSWVVTAIVDGKKVVSPSVSAPEIKFAILSAPDSLELARLKQSKSHLALGVFFARAGLLKDAEREFQNLIKLNPKSDLPRKLLRSVRSMKQGAN
jgi:hypothetical protein